MNSRLACVQAAPDGMVTESHNLRKQPGAEILIIVCAAIACFAAAPAVQLVPVRHVQGTQHGFVILRSLDGTAVADGDSIQTVHGEQVTTRTILNFRDRSLYDETAVFSQRGTYRLLSYHLVQRGPAFASPDNAATLDIDMSQGHVVVHSVGDHGANMVNDQRMTLPPDLCNGILVTLLQDVESTALPLKVSYLATTPAPRLVKLVVTKAGSARFSIGNSARTATDYGIKTQIGGVAGLLAPLVGKQPPDAHIWISDGELPAFVKSEAPMSSAGPLLRTELTNPQWPR
jgi:hypothetical protein